MNITNWLTDIGIREEWVGFLNGTFKFLVIALIGLIVFLATKKWLARIVMFATRRTPMQWDDLMFDQKFFTRLGWLLAPIVIRVAMETIEWEHITPLMRLVNSWITVATMLMVNVVLRGINRIYESHAISRERPIKVFIQILQIFLWCAALMVIISIFTDKSVTVLLGGLTAFAAVLMLIFQDSILGFVAGIQLSANNMVRIGDWIVMPSRGVDGDVIEIGLTTVKVQNWDKTITTIPTHKLVSESFTNWRGMEESKGRRIKRSVYVDVSTIRYLGAADLEKIRKSALLRDYIDKKIKELEEWNANRSSELDERRLTNIGTFREYLEHWIAANPNINQEMTHMVRQLQSGPTGLPLEIYCFSAKQAWIAYEQIQSDIFDHVFAVMPLFNLRAFQYSGVAVDPHA